MTKTLWSQALGRASHGWRSLRPVRLWAALIFEPRDLWLGARWTRPEVGWAHALDIYVCVLPTLPLKVMLRCDPWRVFVHDFKRVLVESRGLDPGDYGLEDG